ncbi:MAG: 1-deoxy-D-xylulose-5-phosphate reductoisomerase [Eubacteriaceae bacterium]|jgi:1-deoxy-D-xylulose-5-phosphate reductoisomerase|uniref:1-deoxy-D-xylulose 5-phosphate reductoisomerase n=1 Tax=Candidatus Pseudoramibacter fermentans TaxID=2594427 RepID=A0A6L5GPF4_9FIRM|nr:1-deoxy-D-xylulose-5-phosphate reductoisomerase [Candidatus Pseudoramibacter fermentans]RRF91728.1 MAG: 1-deoxy-D-xylulose-5-phosphate reductoisomerase [Eubacteriaceae bacterium]
MKRHLAILGSTGSIGTQTLDVVRMHPDLFKVTALGCCRSIDLAEKQAREFGPSLVAVYDEGQADVLKTRLSDTNIRVVSGMAGLIELASQPEADTVVTAIVGMIGVEPTVAAIEAGKDIALANKETCVTAGHIIMPLAEKHHVNILPVDSEHSAIFQSLQGKAGSKIHKILLTASGGPFRGMSKKELAHVTVKETLAHPTWQMGPKVTVDSATMVNKGLEVIEARWLFDVDPDDIQVVIQPQSIIHSMVEYEDHSVIAQLATSDMRVPIQYALTWPDHLPSPADALDFTALKSLDFDVPDNETFRGLPLAVSAIKTGGSMPCAFNAANEWANAAFRRGEIRFLDIYDIIERVMAGHQVIASPTVLEIREIANETFEYCDRQFKR